MQLKHGSLFSGIGGFDLAAEWAGWKNVLQCENDGFCRKILDYYWPDVPTLDDIKNVDFKKYEGTVDVISGGFPCQPFSQAGKRKGSSDNRYLWPEMLRAIQEIKPRWVVGENVRGIVNWNRGMVFKQVITDLENSGYQVQTFIIPACSKNAPHRRDRIWFIAHANATGLTDRGEQHRGESAQIREREHSIGGCCVGVTPDAISSRYGRSTEKTRNITSGEERTMVQNSGWNGDEVRSETKRCGKVAPDTDGDGFIGGNCEHEVNTSEGGVYALNDIEQNVVTYTSNKRLQRSKFNRGIKRTRKIKRESRQFMQPICSTWEDFPTQSPICGRNDGVSRKLDSITFSKWRIESIKAYGNAIVPQIALAIFDSINKYEESLC